MTQMDLDSYRYLTVKLFGGQQNYENSKKVSEIPGFKKDVLYYSMLPEERLSNDIDNLIALIQLVRQNVVKAEMLKYVAISIFGPAFTLISHFEYFGRIFENHSKDLLKKSHTSLVRNLNVIGGVLDSTINLDVTEGKLPRLIKQGDKYVIRQEQNNIYFGCTSNILMDTAIAMVDLDGKTVPVLVVLRDTTRSLLPHVTTRYIGQVISPEHYLIGYNLDGCQVSESYILDRNWSVDAHEAILTHWNFTLVELSLVDLYKGCDLTIRYTTMRRQFKTISNSKEERPISQYQAVLSRLADGITTAYALSSLYNKLKNSQNLKLFSAYLPYIHHVALQRLIHLRQCCGGYGYIKYSGMPQLLERVMYRASLNKRQANIPKNPNYLNSFFYYSSTEDLHKEYEDPKANKSQFSYLCILSLNKRRVFQKLSVDRQQQYLFDMVKHTSIEALYSIERHNSYRPAETPLLRMVKYISCTEVLKNADFINWKYLHGKERPQFLDYLIESRNRQMAWLGQHLKTISKLFDFGEYLDVIPGREDAKQFYEEVMTNTKSNRRNWSDFQDFVRKPIIDFLQENNSKL